MHSEVVVRRGTDGSSRWETAWRPIPERLQPFLRSWVGYSETAPSVCRRRELPGPQVVLIVEFGPSIRISESGSETCATRFRGGFVAGLDDSFTITEHDGHQAGMQLNLTPLGARAVLGLPLSELTRRVTSLPDVLPGHRGLADRLADTSSWAERFRVVEDMLVGRLQAAATPCATVTWAAKRIEATGGLVRVAALSAELGFSRKHLGALFREHVGLAPKLYAELVRFARLTARLKASPDVSWASLAFELGFADQAHLAREVRRFSGVPPTEVRLLLAGALSEPLA